MTDTTCRDDAGLDVDEGVPPPRTSSAATASTLAASPTSPSPTSPSPSPPNVRRRAITGAATGFVVTAVAVAVGCAAGGVTAPGALGLGVFVGGWGGASFGFMLVSAISLAEPTEPPRSPRHSAASEVPA